MTKYLSDEEVFGSPQYLSDDEVFGTEEPAAPEPEPEVVTSARPWRGAGAGRGSVLDPRRLDVAAKPTESGSVLENQRLMTDVGRVAPAQVDDAELVRLSRRSEAVASDPKNLRPAAQMTRPEGDLIPINSGGIISRAADLVGAQIDQYSAGLGYKLGDAASAVGLDGAGSVMRGKANALMRRADSASQSVALSADGAMEKYAPQVLAVFPTMAVAAVSGGLPVFFGVSQVQSYAEGRRAGLSPAEALARSVPIGAAEVLGEKMGGTGKFLQALEKAAASNLSQASLKELGSKMLAMGAKEVPSEEATYGMQSAIDMAPGIGLNQDMTPQEFVEGAKDTAIVAAGVGAVGGGAGASIRAASRLVPKGEDMSAERLARSKGFLAGQPKMVSFADPNGPASQAGITPIVVPVSSNPGAAAPTVGESNVGPADGAGGLAAGAGGSGSDLEAAGVGSAGRDPGVAGGVGVGAAEVPAGDAGAGAVERPGGEPSASLKPVPQTADDKLLARVPQESEPDEVLMRRGGGGYESQESAQTAMATAQARSPTLRWQIEPMANGNFRVAGYAQEQAAAPAQPKSYDVPPVDLRTTPVSRREGRAMSLRYGTESQAWAAADAAGIADNVKVEDTGTHFTLAPAEKVASPNDNPAEAEKLVAELRSAARDQAIKLAPSLRAGADPAAPGGGGASANQGLARKAVQLVSRVTQAAFGFQPVVVTGLNGYGVAFKGNVFVNADAIAEDAGSGRGGIAALAVSTVGHEASHGLLQQGDADSQAIYENFRKVVSQYLREGVVEQRRASESKYGPQFDSDEYAANEVMADISGAMWLDPRFWKRLYEIDGGSTMRRVAYRFMQAATKFIEAAKGSRMDIDTFVSNIEAVREAAAQAWAEKAKLNSRKLESRTAIKAKLFEEEPSFKRRGVVGEVAPNPDKPVAKEWDAMSAPEKETANRDVGSRVFRGVMDINGLRGWEVRFSSGQYLGKTNPNFIIEAADGASFQQLERVARDVGFVLDQQSMVAFDESASDGDDIASFVKVVLPSGFPQAKLAELRALVNERFPQADSNTLISPTELIFGNFTGFGNSPVSDADFHAAITSAIESLEWDGPGSAEVKAVERFRSKLIWPDNRFEYVRSSNEGSSRQDRQGQGRDGVRSEQGRRLLELRRLARESVGRRQQWIDASESGRKRAEDRRRSAARNVQESGFEREYGRPGPGSVAAVGHHYSQQRRQNLSSVYFGTGLKGLERERLSGRENDDIRARLNFYVDSGSGVHPESGVGGASHVIKLNNLYDAIGDPDGLVKNSRGATPAERANGFERAVLRAGYDGYLAAGGNQNFAVLIGRHDIRLDERGASASFSRRRVMSEDEAMDYADKIAAKKSEQDAELDAFNAQYGGMDDPIQSPSASATPKEVRKERFIKEVGAVVSSKGLAGITKDDLKARGLFPERALPAIDVDVEADGSVIVKMPMRAYGDRFVLQKDGDAYEVQVDGSWLNSSDTAGMPAKDVYWFAFSQHSARAIGKVYDLASAYRKGTILRIASVWKEVAQKSGFFRLPRAKTGATLAEIVNDMRPFPGWEAHISDSNYFRFYNPNNGVSREAAINMHGGADKAFHVCTLGLADSNLGVPFYAVVSEWALANGYRFVSDSTLSGINAYRRTEQAASFALKTGNTGVLLPGVQNRVYGYNMRPQTQEDHDFNIARLMLAGMRNAMEVDPDIRRLRYDPATDTFSDDRGRDANDVATAFVKSPTARAFGMGRTTLARAVLTSQIVSGRLDPSDIEKFKTPIAYSRRVLQDPADLEEPQTPAYSRSPLDAYLDARNKSLQRVSPQSVLDGDFTLAVKAIDAAMTEMRAGKTQTMPIPIGPLPHALGMLGWSAQMMRVDSSVLRKVLMDKHADDFADATAAELVSAIYRPALVLKAGNDEMEIVTSIVTPRGPIIVPIKRSVPTPGGGSSSAAIMSAYARNVAGQGNSLLNRIKGGSLVYADPVYAQIALTGRRAAEPGGGNTWEAQFSEAPPPSRRSSAQEGIDTKSGRPAGSVADAAQQGKPRNPNYVGWSQVRDMIFDGIAAKKIKTDTDLIRWIGNNYRADRNERGWDDAPAYSRKPFYSALQRQVEAIQSKAQAPEGWIASIKGLVNKGAVKADEVEWSGVADWLRLQQGRVTRDQVLEYLRGNGVRVEETVLQSRDSWRHRLDILETRGRANLTPAERLELDELREYRDDFGGADRPPEKDQTKFDTYTLPGGTNYREVLLTLPSRADTTPDANGFSDAREEAKDFRSGHWEQRNVLAHIRLNDRTDADGKRVLFVEEIQSDFGQAFRKQRDAIAKAVDSDFNGIVERMKNAGVLTVECD